MISIALNYWRPVLTRWLVLAGLIPALVLALVVTLWSIEAKKECRGGAFSAGFIRALLLAEMDVRQMHVCNGHGSATTQINYADGRQACCSAAFGGAHTLRDGRYIKGCLRAASKP
jgi:hypothetical protein